ncbi:50S ribosomal protein L4 [Candidatus Nanohalococcus occultus]|uniref:50S ribosomal protein L4 n=1 Tax=Candidatus Nanohalococcus occultus TaxID=2978047 RepID=UPI0039DFA5AA
MTDLPKQFNERVRPDIVKRAVLSIQSKNRQSYGSDRDAGLKQVTRIKQRSNAFRTQKGRGMSRTPKKAMLARGSQFYWVGAKAPHTRGGRRAHAPKAEKDWEEEVNDKERRKAIRSGIAASTDKDLVSAQHRYDGEVPIIDEGLESIEKTQELKQLLEDHGMTEELERVKKKKVRAGRGSNRGRKYKRRVGPLVVVAEDNGVFKAASNLPGVDVTRVENLNAEKLAPGAEPGRLCVWSESAIEKLEEDQLFE